MFKIFILQKARIEQKKKKRENWDLLKVCEVFMLEIKSLIYLIEIQLRDGWAKWKMKMHKICFLKKYDTRYDGNQ